MKPNHTSSKEPISELGKALAGAIFWITVGTAIIRWGKFIASLLGDLFLIAWLILVTAGIWSKDLYLLQVSGTIIMVGLVLYAIGKLINTAYGFYYPKPKPELKPDPKANVSAGVGDLMLQTFLIEKMKTDPAFHKEVIARMTAQAEEKMGGTFKRTQESEESATAIHQPDGVASIRITEVEAEKEEAVSIYKGFEIDYYPHAKRYFPRYHKRYLFYWGTKKIYTLQDEIAMAVFSETKEEAINHIKLYIELSKGLGVKTTKVDRSELT